MNLPKFSSSPTLSERELISRLLHPEVRRVIHFSLGPAGTNIAQACDSWSHVNGIQDKAEILLCSTPEESLAQARLIREGGVVPFFWSCAVFYALNELFFNNPDVFPFLFSYRMPLDKMQLCVKSELTEEDWNNSWRIASHPSPTPLVSSLRNPIVQTTSNSQAAAMCVNGEVEACVTTAQAAQIHRLSTVHEFGSPAMVFFAGTTQHGISILLG